MNVYLDKFTTHFEIHRMHREGHSITQIGKYLVLDSRAVGKFLSMSKQVHEAFLMARQECKKILLPYEDFVKGGTPLR